MPTCIGLVGALCMQFALRWADRGCWARARGAHSAKRSVKSRCQLTLCMQNGAPLGQTMAAGWTRARGAHSAKRSVKSRCQLTLCMQNGAPLGQTMAAGWTRARGRTL